MIVARSVDYISPLQEFVASVLEDTATTQRELVIADQHVRVASSYRPLTDTLIPAIEHLCVETEFSPDFTIFLIDLSQTNDGRLPVIPWEPLLRRGHRGIHVDGVSMQYVHIQSTGARILSVYDMSNSHAYYLVNDTEKLPWYICGAPLHEIFYWWARSNRMHILHSGVIGNSHQGIALLGAKGAGKSTLVLAALANGFQYVSEDYCIVSDNEVPVAHSLYNSAKFTDFTFRLFPHLNRYKTNSTAKNDKHLVFYKDIYPEKIRKQLPIKAFVSLVRNDNPSSTINRVDEEKTYLDMIASTTLQNPIYDISSTRFFQNLKSRSNGYELKYSSCTKTTLDTLSELIDEAC